MAGYRYELKRQGGAWEYSATYKDRDAAQRARLAIMRLPHMEVGPIETVPPPTPA